MAKTIKEVAEMLDITPQAIYKVLKQANNELNNCLITVERNGKTLKAVNSKGIELLKQRFNSTVETTDIKPGQDKALETLIKQLEIKDKQLEAKDKQLEELNQRLKAEQELNKNNQIMLHTEKQKTLPAPSRWEKLKSVFKSNE